MASLCKRYLDNYTSNSFSISPVTRETGYFLVRVKHENIMLQIAGYRLPFHSTHVVCPVCTSASGNPCSISVQPVQPCCFYPAEICPELPVQLPGSSVMALPPSSFRPYGIAVKPRNTLPVSYRHIQPLQNENATRSQAEGNDGISGVTSNSGT